MRIELPESLLALITQHENMHDADPGKSLHALYIGQRVAELVTAQRKRGTQPCAACGRPRNNHNVRHRFKVTP